MSTGLCEFGTGRGADEDFFVCFEKVEYFFSS